MSRRPLLLVICFALLAICFLPMPYLVCPGWDVWVVDKSGAPQTGITVRVSYQDYSLEKQGHEENTVADSRGYAHFAERESRASLAERFFGILHSAATGGVHASFGRHASVFAFGDGKEGYAVSGEYVADWTGSPKHMESRIIVGGM
jgi:hypothetical protein